MQKVYRKTHACFISYRSWLQLTRRVISRSIRYESTKRRLYAPTTVDLAREPTRATNHSCRSAIIFSPLPPSIYRCIIRVSCVAGTNKFVRPPELAVPKWGRKSFHGFFSLDCSVCSRDSGSPPRYTPRESKTDALVSCSIVALTTKVLRDICSLPFRFIYLYAIQAFFERFGRPAKNGHRSQTLEK